MSWPYDIGVLPNKQFSIALDLDDPNYANLFMLAKSLLNSKEDEDGIWSVPYDDLLVFQNKLEMSGLLGTGLISDSAYNWYEYLQDIDERNQRIKNGEFNEEIKKLLEGKLKTVPYDDQYTAVAYLYYNKRAGLFDQMGVGKSLELLASVAIMEDVKKTLIICPYTVLIGFFKEVFKHTHLRAIQVPRGKAQAAEFVSQMATDPSWDIMLVHPENLVASKSKESCNEVAEALMKINWDLIAVDEFHMYKNLEAKRTKCIDSIIRESRNSWGKYPRVIVMTGTPVSESPTNAYLALKIFNYGKVTHITKFENHFVVKAPKTIRRKNKKGVFVEDTFWDVVGYKNLDELKSRLGRLSIGRSKADMKGFPPKVFVVRDVFLEGKQLELYKKICGEVVSGISKDSFSGVENFLNNNNRLIRLRQAMNHPMLLGEEGDSAKYKELDNILEELLSDPEQKVVIWTEFRAAVDLLFQRYDSEYGAVKIYGGVDNDELAKIAEKFENGDRPRVAIAIPAKAGTGVDFLARARTAIYVDRPYSLVLYKQSLDRIHRRVDTVNPKPIDIIRSKPATIMFLDIVNSVDELVREKLANKWDVAEAVTTSNESLVEMGRGDLLKYLL